MNKNIQLNPEETATITVINKNGTYATLHISNGWLDIKAIGVDCTTRLDLQIPEGIGE
jgi:hypothetical protein